MKKKMGGGGVGGWGRKRDRLLCYCLALSLLDFIGGGDEAAVSKQQWILWMVQPLTMLRVRC